MRGIITNKDYVAYCGLYCGTCGAYLKEKCNGCHENTKAAWCKIRKCCIENKILSCAECKEFTDVNVCKKYNNMISKIFGFIFNSDRKACIDQIKDIGIDKHAEKMAGDKCPSIKKR